MSIAVTIEQLLDYSDEERDKWRAWTAADPARLRVPFQAGGRFPTIGSLLDHVFLVERRHLARLEGATPPDSTGIAEGDRAALWEYADLVRADMRKYLADLSDAQAAEPLTFTIASGEAVTMTRRKLAIHMLLHEMRHLAQLAYAVRAAGLEPPGQHDFFYSRVDAVPA